MQWVVNATTRPIYPRERSPVPIVEEVVWATGPWKVAENLVPNRLRSADLSARSE